MGPFKFFGPFSALKIETGIKEEKKLPFSKKGLEIIKKKYR
jgi:hypothetical protein